MWNYIKVVSGSQISIISFACYWQPDLKMCYYKFSFCLLPLSFHDAIIIIVNVNRSVNDNNENIKAPHDWPFVR